MRKQNSSFYLPLLGCYIALIIVGLDCKSITHESSGSEKLESKSTGLKMRLIEPGSFLMGSADNEYQSDSNEHPQFRVTLTKAYYIGVYEVTQSEFEGAMGFNPSTNKSNGRLPVETLSWYDAVMFCNRLSKLDGLDTCYVITNVRSENEHVISADVVWRKGTNGYRLPTEAEWEFACRAGTTAPFPYGNTISTIQANYDGTVSYLEKDGSEHLRNETKGIYRRTTLPVDSLVPNNFGLYNIVGNVFEWVWDYYGKYPASEQVDPTGPIIGSERVRRSGAYGSPGYHMRSALRHNVPPGLALFHQGLRVAKNGNLK